MAREACPNPNRAGCPWQDRKDGCFSDSDHIIPQRLARRKGATPAERQYIMTNPDNRQQLCRWEHEMKTEQENDFALLRELRQKLGEIAMEGVDHGSAA